MHHSLHMIGAYLPYTAPDLPPHRASAFRQALGRGAGAPHRMAQGRAVWVGDDDIRTDAGDIVLFSGHIQNRATLRSELGVRNGGDAALYAAAYSRWGDAADLKVLGEFATIVLDRHAPLARLSTSPTICRPLHYWHDREKLIVANRAQAVFDTGMVERVLDEQKVADSLFLNYNDQSQGWFVGLKRLPASHRARITPEGVRLERYYDLASVPDVRLARDEDYVEAADALFAEGVRAMLDGFERPAVSLSGGYDSQAVAAYTIAARPGKPLLGLTSVPEAGWDGVVPENRFGDERPYVEALAAMYPELETRWIDSAGRSFDHYLEEMFRLALQAPRNAMNLHWIHDSYAEARDSGCDVVLNGAFGNLGFSYSGNGALPGWLAEGSFLKIFRELAATGSLLSMPRRFLSRAVSPHLPNKLWQKLMVLRHGSLEDPFESWCPMRPDYALDMGIAKRADNTGFDAYFRPVAQSRDERRLMIVMAGGEGADTKLALDLLHKMPSRDPTSYRPLVEFCLGAPDDQYLHKGHKRWLAKRMLSGKVPNKVLNEHRLGLQAADWHLRLARQRNKLIDELEYLQQDTSMALRIDLDGFLGRLKDFPSATPVDQCNSYRLKLALPRGIITAKFIRYLEGKNR